MPKYDGWITGKKRKKLRQRWAAFVPSQGTSFLNIQNDAYAENKIRWNTKPLDKITDSIT
jgi:hypothetical protein